MAGSTSRQSTNRNRPVSKDDGPPGGGQNNGPKTGLGLDVQKAYALLIGVGRCRYQEWSLPVTTRDVRQLEAVLADTSLCAYPRENIETLTDEAATREGILAALDRLAARAANDDEATVFVYYSGHGWRQSGANGFRYYLIPNDVTPFDIAGSALPAEQFIAGLQGIRSRRLLVMIDTCHASGFGEAKSFSILPAGFVVQPPSEAVLGSGEGRALFLSCREDQKSWILPGAESLSVFTHELINGLTGAGFAMADDGRRTVTVADLMRHLGTAVPAGAASLNERQTPFFKFETEEFAVAFDRGGSGDRMPVTLPEPKTTGSTFSTHIGSIVSGGDTIAAGQIGTLTTRGARGD